ncbi:TonB-dependent receptor [Methylophaga lonarensis]|uniref:TonB-dependent receptor n=1 Tax=Methylophaga lonarensis TaxID=999151 RepID=UPI003D2A711A
MYAKKPLALLVAAALSPVAFSVTADENVDFQRLIVTSDPLGNRTADEIIQPVSVLAGDELNRSRSGTLGETLDGLPGVTNSDFGPGVGRPVIRGLQGSRIKVLEDGLSTADLSGEGADHATAIDPNRATQIEVFRGPATLLYGSGAAGGVVNVRSNRFNPEFGDAPRVEGDLSYGENGNDRNGRLGLDLPVSENLIFRADISARRTSDFDIKGYQDSEDRSSRRGKLENSSVENNSHALTALYRDDWGNIGIGYSFYETEYNVPAFLDSDGDGELEYIPIRQDRFDLRSELDNPLPGIETARLKIAHTRYRQKEIASEFEGGVFEEREVEGDFRNRETDLRLELVHNPIGLWQGVVGLDFNDSRLRAEDPRSNRSFYIIRPVDSKSYGLFTLQERPTSFGRVELAARVEHVDYDPGTADLGQGINISGVPGYSGETSPAADLSSKNYTPYSLSAGTIIDVDHAHHLRFSLTRSQRAPSAEQLYAFGRHAAAGTFEVGDPGLSKETYTNFEIGLDRHEGRFRYDASIFYNHARNFIYLESYDDGTGNPVIVNRGGLAGGSGGTAQFVTNEQANARFYGAEFAAIADLVEGPVPVSMRLSADYVRAKFTSGGNLPRISPMRMGLGFDTSFNNVNLSLDYQRVFKQNKTASVEDSTSGYNLVSFDVSWKPVELKGAELYFAGRNLLNEDGRRHTSFFKDEAPIIGRSLFAGVRFSFGG